MMHELRELEKELGLQPVDERLFGGDLVARAKALGWYFKDLADMRMRMRQQQQQQKEVICLQK